MEMRNNEFPNKSEILEVRQTLIDSFAWGEEKMNLSFKGYQVGDIVNLEDDSLSKENMQFIIHETDPMGNECVWIHGKSIKAFPIRASKLIPIQ